MKSSSSPSPSPTSSPYPADSEWKVLQRRILSILPWMLAFSAAYLLVSTSRRSNPSIIILNTALNPSPPSLPIHNNNNNITTSTASNACNETTIHKESPTPIMPQDQSTTNASCDLFDGRWVWEKREAAYTNATCRTLPGIRDCNKYGKDPSHLNWRWKPDGCELPRFDPWAFLGIVRGKKLAFVGDSLARNHMESMLCSLSQTICNAVEMLQNYISLCRIRSPSWRSLRGGVLKAVSMRILSQRGDPFWVNLEGV